MKKKIILLFAMLATVVLLAVGFTIGASATTYNVSTASDFTSKISSAASGDTINVTADISVSTQSTIAKTLTITSSNGSTVTVGVSRLFLVGNSGTVGNLTINGDIKFVGGSVGGNIVTMVNGTATLEGSAQLKADDTPVLMFTDGGTMKANCSFYIKGSALIESTASGHNAFYLTSDNASKRGSVYVQGGTIRSTGGNGIKMASGNIYMTGGTIEAQYPIDLFYGNSTANKTVQISGGTLTGSTAAIVCEGNTQRASITISGGTVTGVDCGINTSAVTNATNNSITVSGGTVSATGSSKSAIILNGCTLTVEGGTISASTGIYMTKTVTKSATIKTGAYIYGTTNGINCDGSNATLTISGGTIIGGTNDINGITPTWNGGCAKIGSTYYSSLKSAVAAASSGSTITVLENTKIPAAITIDKSVTITTADSTAKTITTLVTRALAVGTSSTAGTLTLSGYVKFTGADNIVTMVNGTAYIKGHAGVSSNSTPILLMTTVMQKNSTVYIQENAEISATASGDENVFYMTTVDGNASAAKGTVYVQGGTISNPNGKCFNMTAGTVNVSGGTINAKYPFYLWYGNSAAVKSVTISGGNVGGSNTYSAIYVNTNAKNLTLKITGGTVSTANSEGHAIDYRADQSSANNSISIEGGTVTAPGQTIFLYRCSAVGLTIKGSSTVSATNGGLTIYGAELRGDTTLTISGSPTISATGANTIQCTKPGNTSTYPGKFVATISGGTISAGTEHAISVQNSSYTISGGLITAPGVTVYGNKSGGSVSISGGEIKATGSNAITLQSETSQTISISGTAKVTATGDHAIWLADQSGATITISGGTVSAAGGTIFFNRSQAVTLTISGGAKVRATNGGNTIYGAEMRGNLTLNVSGSSTEITATGNDAIVVSGTSTTYTGRLAATIQGGTISAAEKTINLQSGSVNISGGTISATTQYAIFSNQNGGSVTISGGTVTAPTYTIYFEGNGTKDLSITGGTVSATGSCAIRYYNGSGGTVTISGATVTATGSTIFTERAQAITMTISNGAKIRATDGGNTIYTAEPKADLVLTVDGSSTEITATGENAIQVTKPSNTSTYPGKLVAEIKNCTISAGVQHAITVGNADITIKGGTVTAPTVTIYAHKSGGKVTITGGVVKTTNGGSNVITIADQTDQTLIISGTAQVTAADTHAIWFANNAGGSVTISGGTVSAVSSTIFLNRSQAVTLNITGGTIQATTGGNTIYGAELRGDLTLGVSGSPTISAATSDAIVVSMPSDTTTYPGKLIATIENGTISAGTEHAINVQHGSVTMTGGTVTAPSATVYMNKAGGSFSVSGGTVRATTGGNTIAILDAGTRTVTVSGTAIISAATNSAIMGNAAAAPTIYIQGGTITAGNDFCIDTQGGSVSITGGTLTAGGYCTYLRGKVTYTVSNGKLTAGENAVFAFSTTAGARLNISGGTFVLKGTNRGAKIINEAASCTNCTVTINGGLFVNSNTGNYKIISDFTDSTNTVNFNYIRVLYQDNLDTIITINGSPLNPTRSDKAATVVYDANGNGKADADETYYFYAKYNASNSQYSGALVEGAAVRTASTANTKNGLRFKTSYTTTQYNYISSKSNYEFGTIIIPTTKLAKVNRFTIAGLTAAGYVEGKDYVRIPATLATNATNGGIHSVTDGYEIRAALNNLYADNFEVQFSAVGYAKYSATGYYYTGYNSIDNSRAIFQVAIAAMDDVSATKSSDYPYQITLNGVKTYSPYEQWQRDVLQNYNTITYGVPVLSGKTLTLLRSGDETFQYYTTSATLSDYNNYKTLLANNGYTLFAERTWDNNKFATYTGKGKVLTLCYTPAKTTLRLLMEPEAATALPTTSAQNTGYGTGTAATVTQIGQWYTDSSTESHKSYYFNSWIGETRTYATKFTSGMGYVIQLSDGSFIVVDGGYATQTHAENLYNVMKKQAGSENFTIAAWVFTHVHDDHAGAFRRFTELGYWKKVTVERFIYNFPSGMMHEAQGYTSTNDQRNEILEYMKKYEDAQITVGHAGQVFYVRNATINILFTAELMEPHTLDYYNSVSMVFRIDVESKKLLFFGDCGGNNSMGGSEMAYINSIYTASTLDSDFLQASHHGLDPETDSDGFSLSNFYKNKVSPSYVFFPVASEYVKVDGSYVILQERNESYLWKVSNQYLGRDDVWVITLSGTPAATKYETVTDYIG